ncbi:MAG: VWA domain-containing protein [Bradymonadaceae bacterium]|nr:VWA domain-containing protein [Lujinxingiaceae bacterium]
MSITTRCSLFLMASLLACTLGACSSEPDDTSKKDTSGGADIEEVGVEVDADVSVGPDDVAPEVSLPDGGGDDAGQPDGGDAYCAPNGPGWTIDSDQDGLTDCEEMQMCTDPYNHDTDGDGLSDLEELQLGTDPCKADSDGDGLSDFDELVFGFDPLNDDTYGDGILDGDRWIVTACDEPVSEPLEYHKNSLGNWTMALHPAFRSYTNLSVEGADFHNRHAAAVFDDPANEISGFVFSSRPSVAQTGPVAALLGYRPRVAAFGAIQQDSTGGEFATHDFHRAAISRFLVRSPQARSPRAVRDALLLQLVPSDIGAISGFPSAAGNTHNDYRIFMSVVYRGQQMLTVVAFAPAQKFETHDKIKFRMDDLTNTTNLAGVSDVESTRCTSFRPGLTTPQVDFYWVLDQSGSMNNKYVQVRAVAAEFFAQLINTPLDFRLGVANMAESTEGRLRSPPGWHTELATFNSEIEDWVVRCTGCTGGYGGLEHGLLNAKRGIDYMTSNQAPAEVRIRPEAKIVTIIMSDEEDQSIQNNAMHTPAGQAVMNDYLAFFPGRTTMFSIVSQGGSCGHNAQAYMQVALATGGSFYDLCAVNIEETITEIIVAATGQAASHVLPDTPVSSSLRVFKDGKWVPRSRANGFDYFSNTNSIAFFGSFRPDPDSDGATDHIAVTYRHYKMTTKPDSVR